MNTVRIRRRMKRSAGSWIFDVFNYTFMVLFCLSILFPFWNMLVTSLSRAEDVSVPLLDATDVLARAAVHRALA